MTCLFLALLLGTALASEPVVLTLTDGRTVRGTLVERTASMIKVLQDDGVVHTYATAMVRRAEVVGPSAPLTDRPLALPVDADPQVPLALPVGAEPTTPTMLAPQQAPRQPEPVQPRRIRRPAWGLGLGAAVGARAAPGRPAAWNPVSWEELALSTVDAPPLLSVDVGTIELRWFTSEARSVDILVDLVDTLIVPAAKLPRNGETGAFSVSLAAMNHTRSGDGIARIAFAPGAGLRVQGYGGAPWWIAPYAMARVGVDVGPRSRVVELGIYARFELGLSLGINPLEVDTLAGALLEVTLTVNKLE